MLDSALTIPAQLRAHARLHPDTAAHTLLTVGELTYADWHHRSTQVAVNLIHVGCTRGARIVLPCDSTDWLRFAVLYVGVQKAGAIPIPVVRTLGEEHITSIYNTSQASALVTSRKPEHLSTDLTVLTPDELEHASRPPVRLPDVSPADVAEITYTSGTTATPKGVVATHANMLFAHRASTRRASSSRLILHALAPATTVGQGLLLQPLHPDMRRVLTLSHFTAASFLAAVEEHAITDVVLVPALAIALLTYPSRDAHDLTTVKLVRSTSAPIAPATLAGLSALFPNARIMNVYSSTESWPARTQLVFDPKHPDSVGRAAGGSVLRIVDPDGAPQPHFRSGRVQLRMPDAPMRWYDRDPVATQRVFGDDGWITLSDIGYLDNDGYLYLIDRDVDLVNSGGLNISTLEIEAALYRHPAVRHAAAFGLPHAVLGEYPVAAIVLNTGTSADDVLPFVNAQLGAAKAPRQLFPCEHLPRNELGKVLKRELRAIYSSQVADARLTFQQPEQKESRMDLVERIVLTICAHALDIDVALPDVDFLAQGGTSLTALSVLAAVHETFAVTLSQLDLFQAPSLAAFAETVASAARQPPSTANAIVPVPRTPH